MAEPAIRRMRLDEFLVWDDGTDTRYELIEGVPVAMAPPARAQGMLRARLGAAIEGVLRSRRHCTVRSEAAIARPDRADTCHLADLAVTRRPHRRGEQLVEELLLIVEVLSPGSQAHDRQEKVPAYRRIASVAEILLIDSESCYAEVLRRDGARWTTGLVQGAGATLSPASLDMQVAMAELYGGVDLAPAA